MTTTQACIRRGNLTTWSSCRCESCKAANCRLAKLARNGRFDRIPSAYGLAILRRMMESGMTAPAIASAVDVSENTASNWLAKLRTGKPLQLGAVACQKLANAKPPTDGFIGSLIPRRMLRALGRIGWSCDHLTRDLRSHGVTIGEHTLWAVRNGRTDRVRAQLANQIADLYSDLQMTPGPSDQTIRLATADKWPGPLSWDDINDPNAKPVGVTGRYIVGDYIDEAAVVRRMAGDRVTLTKEERIEVVRRLRVAEWTFNQIEEHTGLNVDRYIAREKAAA
jgi:transposase